ncbi:ABC transporter permease [Hydrogenophaga crassostreae]|uniref:ABC transporter permease n=1 Tax=Hydrogenophaga crassostreae TaxID=1763535 RepID=A0A162P7C4_9BURK|nr:ABC transporter permease [Hydrogenophaga crassostreae]AOW15599.1 ABC transporter permease [Hydrogenophaga crassostreae]OAD42064.1 ABC transporter permease [Hydrogenophaga crassostreae]
MNSTQRPPASHLRATAPRVVAAVGGGTKAHRAVGDWTAGAIAGDNDPREWQRSLRSVASTSSPQTWDLSAVQALDHVGAQILWDLWGQQWPVRLEAPAHHKALLERIAALSTPDATSLKPTLRQRYLALGKAVMDMVGQLRDFVTLLGQLVLDLLALVRAPGRGPWRDVSGHLYQFGATALPITALVGFLIGVVLAYLSAQQLKQFGADAFIVNLLGMSLVRELGPMLAAILVAGRTGSAITAQIGVMRVNEELDAMRVMGIPLGYRLVMPRALALAIAMPLISVWTTVMALLGGMFAADLALGISPQFFFNALPAAVDVSNLMLAVGKTVVFGILIALVACHFGLRIEPNTESLGKGTTASVVTSITVVILVDAMFAIAFRDIGL